MTRRTPLFEAHRELGARFVDFGGWEMPVQYSGIVEEHHAVRRRAGLFDVSHMGEIELRGPHALESAQRLTVNDLGRLRDGQAQYSLLCRPDGGVVDDILVHRISPERVMICVNAGNIEKDFAWMRDHAGGAEVVDRSSEFALLALQGPAATSILGPLAALDLGSIPPFSFAQGRVAGRVALVAHTGYTGEDGWEIYVSPGDARPLWDALLQAGRKDGLLPAGLGARDTLRLERALPLYGHELTDETTPLEAGLAWVVRWDKGDFIGREALDRQRTAGVQRRLTGMVLTEPGIARQGYAVRDGEEKVGSVTSGTKSPTLGKAIALGYVAGARARTGTRLQIEIREKTVAAEVVRLPFYKR